MAPTNKTKKSLTRQCSNCKISVQKTVSSCSEHAHIMFVGISGKSTKGKDFSPLSNDSRSGSILSPLLTHFGEDYFYKTNLVKCHPTDLQGKTRYPTKEEISNCKQHIMNEITLVKPRIIFLLGKIVTDHLLPMVSPGASIVYYSPIVHLGIAYLPIHHPSYISIYKRKHVDEYISRLSRAIESHASS